MKIIYEKSYNTTNVELEFSIRNAPEKEKKNLKKQFWKVNRMYVHTTAIWIYCPKFKYQILPTADS